VGHDLKCFRRFILYRYEDECRVSGTGIVAEGIQFSSGRCAITWLSETPSTSLFDSTDELEAVHGHGGKTEIRWIDAGDKLGNNSPSS
jgi:hypothetical protein